YGDDGHCTVSSSSGCHLSIVDKSLSLVGEGDGIGYGPPGACGPGGCGGPAPTQSLVTLDGNASAGRVLSISGSSNVTVKFLEITGGNLSGSTRGDGGGIGFQGTGSLTLDASSVDDNAADYGAGINIDGSGDADHIATLTLAANTLIVGNTAAISGGGIRMEGHAQLFALKPQTAIFYNHAPGGYGGGIEVIGPARADIASPGYNGDPVIQFNDAAYGGGIAAYAGGDNGQDTVVQLFTTDPAHPVQVSNNTASHTGGGIYLDPHYAFAELSTATLCAFDFRIDNNIAQQGAAIYADEGYFDYLGGTSYHGGVVALNVDEYGGQGLCGQQNRNSLGAVHCRANVPCNTIHGNAAQDAGGQATAGSTILIQKDGTLHASAFDMRGNEGAHVISITGQTDGDDLPAYATLDDCLIADNSASDELIELLGLFSDPASLDGCTVVGNAIGGTGIGFFDEVDDALIFQPGKPIQAHAAQCVLADDISLLEHNDTVRRLTDPEFVDPGHGNYHLQLTSPAVDFAGGVGGSDLEGYPRDTDLASVANVFGPRDLGAYERQLGLACDDDPDAIFCNGFEGS
ncbi:MAG: hypothetical protein WBV39_16710, partial [Rudaea sp.]